MQCKLSLMFLSMTSLGLVALACQSREYHRRPNDSQAKSIFDKASLESFYNGLMKGSDKIRHHGKWNEVRDFPSSFVTAFKPRRAGQSVESHLEENKTSLDALFKQLYYSERNLDRLAGRVKDWEQAKSEGALVPESMFYGFKVLLDEAAVDRIGFDERKASERKLVKPSLAEDLPGYGSRAKEDPPVFGIYNFGEKYNIPFELPKVGSSLNTKRVAQIQGFFYAYLDEIIQADGALNLMPFKSFDPRLPETGWLDREAKAGHTGRQTNLGRGIVDLDAVEEWLYTIEPHSHRIRVAARLVPGLPTHLRLASQDPLFPQLKHKDVVIASGGRLVVEKRADGTYVMVGIDNASGHFKPDVVGILPYLAALLEIHGLKNAKLKMARGNWARAVLFEKLQKCQYHLKGTLLSGKNLLIVPDSDPQRYNAKACSSLEDEEGNPEFQRPPDVVFGTQGQSLAKPNGMTHAEEKVEVLPSATR